MPSAVLDTLSLHDALPISNQFWKFGLLGRDFRYRRFAEQAGGRLLWSTTSGDGEAGAPPFGRAGRIYNVIDSRQMYLQALLSQDRKSTRLNSSHLGISYAVRRARHSFPTRRSSDLESILEIRSARP